MKIRRQWKNSRNDAQIRISSLNEKVSVDVWEFPFNFSHVTSLVGPGDEGRGICWMKFISIYWPV